MKPNAVDKALGLLDLLIGHPEGLRPVDLTRQTGYPPGTLHRLLGTLARNGFVRQEPTTGRYILGHKFLRGFSVMVKGVGLQEKALVHLRHLAQATRQAANLGVLRGDQMVFLESIVDESAGPVMYTPPGTLSPPHCTAMGKVLLASLPEQDVEQYLQGAPLIARTPTSITTGRALVEHLALVRQRGYAVDDEEYNLGIRCVAAPIRDHAGRVIAALSVSAPTHLLSPERVPPAADLVVAAAQAMSAEMGYQAGSAKPEAAARTKLAH